MDDRTEKASVLLVVANAVILLLLGVMLTFLFTEELARERDQGAHWAKVLMHDKSTVTLPLIRQAIEELDSEERKKALGDKTLFQRFVHDRVVRQSILTAVKDDEGLREDPDLNHRMGRIAEQVLVDAYLERKLDAGLLKDFPSEKEVRAFYNRNHDRFRIEERLHAWQIFFVLPQEASDKEFKKVMGNARAVVKKLRTRKLSFSDAAAQYSEHELSRSSGGYLGVFDVSQLLPILKKTFIELDEGEISDPVRSNTGLHILKRGEKIPARIRPFEQVREEIRTEMQTLALDELREKVLSEVYKSHGEPVQASVVEQWRRVLRQDALDPGGETPALGPEEPVLKSGIRNIEGKLR